MPDGRRLWRTEKGGLVEDGHPEARLLAYGQDDRLIDEDAELVRGSEPDPEPEKVEAAPTKKAAPRPPAKK
jgi:hypothetical protein